MAAKKLLKRLSPLSLTAPESVAPMVVKSDSVVVTSTTVGKATAVGGLALPCVTFFHVPGSLGIRNNCAQCKIAVVNWVGKGVYRYRVAGHSEIVVRMESSAGQLIGEDPC
jgi:hypothetical protein